MTAAAVAASGFAAMGAEDGPSDIATARPVAIQALSAAGRPSDSPATGSSSVAEAARDAWGGLKCELC